MCLARTGGFAANYFFDGYVIAEQHVAQYAREHLEFNEDSAEDKRNRVYGRYPPDVS